MAPVAMETVESATCGLGKLQERLIYFAAKFHGHAANSQCLDRETASFHLFRNSRACDSGIRGSKRRSFIAAEESRAVFQKPTAKPARYAAPSAAASVTAEREIRAPRMSH